MTRTITPSMSGTERSSPAASSQGVGPSPAASASVRPSGVSWKTRRPSEVSAMIELAANRLLARVNVSSDEIVEFTAQVERAVLRELALVN